MTDDTKQLDSRQTVYRDFDISIDGLKIPQVIETLSEALTKIPEDYRDTATIELYQQYESIYSRISYKSLETDREYDRRIKMILDREIREKNLYRQLKAKYEPKTPD